MNSGDWNELVAVLLGLFVFKVLPFAVIVYLIIRIPSAVINKIGKMSDYDPFRKP